MKNLASKLRERLASIVNDFSLSPFVDVSNPVVTNVPFEAVASNVEMIPDIVAAIMYTGNQFDFTHWKVQTSNVRYPHTVNVLTDEYDTELGIYMNQVMTPAHVFNTSKRLGTKQQGKIELSPTQATLAEIIATFASDVSKRQGLFYRLDDPDDLKECRLAWKTTRIYGIVTRLLVHMNTQTGENKGIIPALGTWVGPQKINDYMTMIQDLRYKESLVKSADFDDALSLKGSPILTTSAIELVINSGIFLLATAVAEAMVQANLPVHRRILLSDTPAAAIPRFLGIYYGCNTPAFRKELLDAMVADLRVIKGRIYFEDSVLITTGTPDGRGQGHIGYRSIQQPDFDMSDLMGSYMYKSAISFFPPSLGASSMRKSQFDQGFNCSLPWSMDGQVAAQIGISNF